MSSIRPKCVLAVDDDYLIRETVGEMLKLEGYRVEMADSGQQAVAKLRTSRPDAIVLDLMMPMMDGRTCLQQCRTDPLFGARPVVAMSADPKLQETASALHVQGFLAKPFDLDVLPTNTTPSTVAAARPGLSPRLAEELSP